MQKKILTGVWQACIIVMKGIVIKMVIIRRFFVSMFRLNDKKRISYNLEIPGIDPRIIDQVDPKFLAMVDQSIARNDKALRELARY